MKEHKRKEQLFQQFQNKDATSFQSKYINRIKQQMKYASLSKRFFAFLIDFICSSIFISIFPMLITSIITQETSFTVDNLMKLSLPMQMLCCLIAILFAIYYFCIYPAASAHNGQTIGKRIMRIKVQKQDGNRIDIIDLLKRELLGSLLLEGETAFPSAFVRYLAFLWLPAVLSQGLMKISIVISLASILWCIIGQHRCMFHDLIAKTSVVDM